MIFTIIGYLLVLVCLGLILAWITNYCDGRRGSYCNTYITFKAFKKYFSRFPDKWILRNNYVEFITDFSTYESLRLYFKNPIDLLRYHVFYTSNEIQDNRERETKNYVKLVDAFEKLNEWEKKHG